MRSARTRSIRFRILALLLVPLLTLVPLWGFAVFLTAPDGLNLLAIQRLQPEVGVPSDALGTALAAERRAAMVYVADPGSGTAELEKRRDETDAAATKFRKVTGGDVQDVARPETQDLTQRTLDRLGDVAEVRASIDDGSATEENVFGFYSGLVTTTNSILASLTSLDDPNLTAASQSLGRVSASRDLLAQEDALLAAALAGGELDRGAYSRFAKQVGAVQASFDGAQANLPDDSRTTYAGIANGETANRLHAMEDAVIDAGPGRIPRSVTAAQWREVNADYMGEMRALELKTGRTLQADALPIANGILVRAGIAALLGLVGVVLSVWISVRTGRSLIKEITDLKTQIKEVATQQLPNLVRRLRSGRGLDISDLGPSRLAFQLRTRELDDLNWAFDEARRVAVQSATGEAKLRENVNDVIVNLARRNQALLHRQLQLFDQLERRVSDPEELREVFVLDHLATRMRRHAESLLILSGSAPGRGWSRPMPVDDVVRAASTEVEEYTRVSIFPMNAPHLSGGTVTDVIHLLAELIENATSSSPPTSEVLIRGREVANGFAIEIEDGGLGMSEQALADANALLADPPELDLARRTELGHFVVATLARRHGIKVHLRDSPYGGVTAIVLLSPSIIVADEHGAEHDPVTEGRGEPEQAAIPRDRGTDPAGVRHREVSDGGENGRRPHEPAHRAPTPQAGGDGPASPEQPTRPPGPEHAPRPRAARREPQGPAGPARLPQRVRQANLVPQLQDDGAAAGPGPFDDRPPEDSRSMLTALQNGWNRGRRDDTPPTEHPGDPGAPDRASTEAEGDQ
ncbi:nitrate/nitrite sensing protein [Murinocardiopsis flavida]|uniref:histidine kinase n=1 Tax=Murinocardiopsis flavida TaxID=645275 RepID=A0A2P8DQ53_9ACTN|nr:nitrate- and nitrite sensing domain-containing protein [Murinocardiopsis flavida]PSK99322.1 nitrate/nitrite sensing protein [Murinocardiopsis flavida]